MKVLTVMVRLVRRRLIAVGTVGKLLGGCTWEGTENQRRLGGSTTLEVKDSRKIWWDRERQPPSQQCLDTLLKADKRTQVTEFLL